MLLFYSWADSKAGVRGRLLKLVCVKFSKKADELKLRESEAHKRSAGRNRTSHGFELHVDRFDFAIFVVS
jgi:hypothetical protein